MFSAHPGAEAIGATRVALDAMRRDYDRLVTAAYSIPRPLALAYAFKGPVGRDRARQRVLQIVKRRPFIETHRIMVWRALAPRPDPLQLEAPRPGVETIGVAFGLVRGEPVVEQVPLGLWVSQHVLIRAHQRTLGRADLASLTLTLHDALLACPASIFGTVQGEQTWCFPCGDDAVSARLRVVALGSARSDHLAFVSAGTYLNRDLLGADQEAQRAACLYPHPGPKMRDGLMLPASLREALLSVEEFSSLPVNAAEFLRMPKARVFPSR